MQRAIDGPDREYLTLAEVAHFVHLSETTLKRLMRTGEFPRPMNPTGEAKGVQLWHWRAVVYWVLRVEMRPYLRPQRAPRPERAKKKSGPSGGHRGPQGAIGGQVPDESD